MDVARVGVLRGGRGHEYGVSLKTGESILRHLPEDKYLGHDILITKDGQWHWSGLPVTPQEVGKRVDVFFNALHGEYGEDGKIQNQLDMLGVPYTGSGTFASAAGMNKVVANKIFRQAGLRVPHGILLTCESGLVDEINALARKAFNRVPPRWMIKPVAGGSSIGVYMAKNFDALLEAIYRASRYSKQILVEQFIGGREATCGVIDNFRDIDHYALPPIEIRKPGGQAVWSYNDKYSGETEEICPGNFSDDERRQISEMAVAAHKALGLRHYSRADFILSPQGIYLLEVNTLPGMTKESLMPKGLEAVGCSYDDFLDHILSLTMGRR
ncbi:MAG: D-alanine--D-alanine ligase [Patescibacteria group bacterium]|nr:D-alanine--D-alanine ligase [Patescibacteria group bacterium]